MVDEFITHKMPLEEINEAFELMHLGKRLVALHLYQLLPADCQMNDTGDNVVVFFSSERSSELY